MTAEPESALTTPRLDLVPVSLDLARVLAGPDDAGDADDAVPPSWAGGYPAARPRAGRPNVRPGRRGRPARRPPPLGHVPDRPARERPDDRRHRFPRAALPRRDGGDRLRPGRAVPRPRPGRRSSRGPVRAGLDPPGGDPDHRPDRRDQRRLGRRPAPRGLPRPRRRGWLPQLL